MTRTLPALLMTAAISLGACGPSKPVDASSGASRRYSAPPSTRRRAAPPPTRRTPARSTPAKGFQVSGTLKALGGKALPAKASMVVLWSVVAGSPDYVYVFGTGTSQGKRFSLTLATQPPPQALNNGLMGIGIIMLLPAGTTLPTGKVSRKAWRALKKSVIGGADRFGVLWFNPAMANRTARMVDKVVGGYSCGKGYKPATGLFEAFRVVNCSTLVINIGSYSSLRWVNWT